MTRRTCAACAAELEEGSATCAACTAGGGSLELDADVAGRLAGALGEEFEVGGLIGRGGFARVFEVRDVALDRRLAVKVLRTDLLWERSSFTRFKREARAIARLSHPNILPIHFVGEAEGLVFYAMPFLEGRPLTAVIPGGGLPLAQALPMVEAILGALQHAHSHGIVHRDIKPDNIMIEGGTDRPLLVDFGIAKALDGDGTETETGFIVGTPLYMSPEQATGQGTIDARSDLYSIGVVLFQMLTGAPPFHGTDSQEIMGRQITEPVPLARLGERGVPEWLTRVVGHCLAKHPDDRYASASAVIDALRAAGDRVEPALRLPDARSGQAIPPAVAPIAPTVRLPKARPPRRWSARAAAAMGITAGAGVVLAGAAVALRPRPILIVENRLGQPIALTVDDSARMIAPGDSIRLPVAAGEALEAHWAMVRATYRGAPLGLSVEGTIAAERMPRELREVVDAGSDGAPRFWPVVINATDRPITITVDGAGDSLRCGCLVRARDSLALGYYPLDDSVRVWVSDDLGRSRRFGDLDDDADRPSGRVELRITDDALGPRPAPRHPPRSTRRGRHPSHQPVPPSSNPLGAFLPAQ